MIIVATSMSVLATLVVPRGIGSRISIFVGRRLVRGMFLFVARRADEYETKDRVLALAAPIALLTTFAVWLLNEMRKPRVKKVPKPILSPRPIVPTRHPERPNDAVTKWDEVSKDL